MPFVVAAPAAVIGATGALWYLLTLLLGLDSHTPARFISGVVFGLGGFVLLAASSNAPVDRVAPPPWYRSISVGLLCTLALWLVSAAAFSGWSGWLIAVLGGLSCVAADRRTMGSRRERTVHQALLVFVMLATVERVVTTLFVEDDAYVGLGVLCSVLVAIFLPVERFQRWSLQLVPTAQNGLVERPKDIEGYRNEVLALAAFLEPADIPKSLVVAAAQAAGAGRASSLRTLAPAAISETGVDSLHVSPIAQEFARTRMLAEERKAWAARAVRMLAESFPENYRDTATWPWCERLLPHALTAAKHAEELDVARGVAALLLDRVGGYLVECGRPTEAREVTSSALAHASAGFGDTSTQVATLHARLARLNEPGNVTVDMADSPLVEVPDAGDRTALAFHFTSLGDTRRDEGDVAAARRHYTAALAHARYSLGRKHPLVADLRARLDALPGRSKPESDEKRLVLGCFSLVVAVVLICVVFAVIRNVGGDGRMSESDVALTKVEQLADLCAAEPRYYPDAAEFTGAAPHPVHIFRRSNYDKSFRHEPFRVADAPVQETQLVGCAVQTRTGPRVTMCTYPDRPEIPLHQATYLLTVYETRTGVKLGTQTITASRGQCPTTYEPPPEDKPWMLYAGPSDDQYKQALVPIEDVLTTRPTQEVI